MGLINGKTKNWRKLLLLQILGALLINCSPVSRLDYNRNIPAFESEQKKSESIPLRRIQFTYQPPISGVENMFLAGTFNDWNANLTRMTDEDGDGIYDTYLMLPDGRHLYKYVVDGAWITDMQASEFESDGNQGFNSVIIVDDRFDPIYFRPGDGQITLEDLTFPSDYGVVNPINKRLLFTAWSHRDDVEAVYVLYKSKNTDEKKLNLINEAEDLILDYYRNEIQDAVSKSLRFCIAYQDGGQNKYLDAEGIKSNKPDIKSWFNYSPNLLPEFPVPEWARAGIFYQIFPDRFFNGDRANDPDFKEDYYEGMTNLPPSGKTNEEYFHLEDWEHIEGLKISPIRTDGRPDYYSFYGGDIKGVMKKLPYLDSLGVSIVYFNPLNEAPSNHKYDAVDYLKIDPHFADENLFREFVSAAHKRGIRIVVDMAFNHTGYEHFAFKDTRLHGEQSKYWNWFEWHKWPLPQEGPPTPCDYYDCWWGFPIHPNLNFDLQRPNEKENAISEINQANPNKPVVEHIIDVARYWIGKLDIDGFRLDVANEVPFWFWKIFREEVDRIKPDVYLIGEIWGNASAWVSPAIFHSTMNYKYFRDPVLKFFARQQIDAEIFQLELAGGRYLYPLQAVEVMMNLLGSHDTQRFLTLADNDSRKLMLAALFQMTYIGIPHIYYGDEIGMEGAKDPDNRRPFLWAWPDNPERREVHAFYQKMTRLRSNFTALSTGRFRILLAEGMSLAYLREDKDNTLLVALNNSDHPESIRINLNQTQTQDLNRTNTYKKWLNLLDDQLYEVQSGRLEFNLNAFTGAVLLGMKKSP
ncbi:hypothetical protein BVY01_05210 [bacterium I07]|nr:hypothetical protein BVY01_05210 [bacterium I07]